MHYVFQSLLGLFFLFPSSSAFSFLSLSLLIVDKRAFSHFVMSLVRLIFLLSFFLSSPQNEEEEARKIDSDGTIIEHTDASNRLTWPIFDQTKKTKEKVQTRNHWPNRNLIDQLIQFYKSLHYHFRREN